MVYTDASSTGIGAVLEQDNHVIAYASRTLTKPERQYSVIQRECLAVVYALKQFRHYLVGRSFNLVTDHAPLQWLSAQKMEGLLCRWALALQEYDFQITYRKGSQNGNADAIPMPDQTAVRIVRELTKVFSVMGLPQVLHSDQGANFESKILKQTLQAYGITKSRTTAYHPQGDGMVERFNRSLLQLLRTYTQKEADWELHLPLALYAYRTAAHSTTGVSPFEMMFGRASKHDASPTELSFDPSSYQAQLQAKLAALQDFVEAHMVEKATAQKTSYDDHSKQRTFKVGDPVWLSQPTAGKLDPKWDGSFTVKSIYSPVTLQISNGKTTKVVHLNRLRHRLQPANHDTVHPVTLQAPPWTAPQITHVELDNLAESRRYPLRVRNQPDRFHF